MVLITHPLGHGASLAYHPHCYTQHHRGRPHPKQHQAAGERPLGRGCGHCYVCGGILWRAADVCVLHDLDCPKVDFWQTESGKKFCHVWALRDRALTDRTLEIAAAIMSEPNPPPDFVSLADRVQRVLDVTS